MFGRGDAAAAVSAARLIQRAAAPEVAFEYLCAYIKAPPRSFRHVIFTMVGHGERFYLTTMPDAFASRHIAAVNSPADPMTRRALHSTIPLIWGLDEFEAEGGALHDALSRMCLTAGMVMPIRMHTGHTGGLFLLRERSRAELEAMLLACSADITFVGLHFGDRLANLIVRSDSLKGDERECLALLAAGYEIAEISARTAYSARHVRYTIDQIRQRLGARNRAHLVHIAHQTGLL